MIIFLYGQDSFRAKEKLKEIVAEYKTKHKSGLNLIQTDAKEVDFEDFFNNLKITSMFDEKKLVILKNVFSNLKFQEEFSDSIEIIKNKKDVIVIYEKDLIDQRSKFFKLLKKEVKCQEFCLLPPAMLKKWMKQEFEKYGAKINQEAEDSLFQLVGNNLWQLGNEIKKLADYKGLAVIKKEDVELHIRPKIENDIFLTIDALASKNKIQALNFLHKHIESGENPLYLLSMIGYQFKNLLIVKELIDQHKPYAVIAGKSGLHPFVVKKSYYMASQFSMADLKKIYRKIFQVDSNIKSGRIEPETALDMLVAEI